MTIPGQHGLQVLHIAADEGNALWVYGDKDTIKVDSEQTGGGIALMVTEFGPGTGPPPHVHRREAEAFYVMEGEVAALDGDRRFTTGPGSFVYFPKDSHHAFRNVGTTTAKILLMFFPAGFEGYLKDVGAPVIEGQPPPETDMSLAAQVAEKYGMEFLEVAPGVWY